MQHPVKNIVKKLNRNEFDNIWNENIEVLFIKYYW